MSALVKKEQSKNNTGKERRINIREELANKLFDTLVKEGLINPENFTTEELELLLAEVLIDLKGRLKITK